MQTITNLAIRLRQPYRVVYDRALRGEFGEVVRQGTRIYVKEPAPADKGTVNALAAAKP